MSENQERTEADRAEAEDQETEPTETLPEDSSGVEGQIEYPEQTVDAERAGAFAAGKVDSLDPDRADESGWQNPADRSGEEQTDEETEPQAREETSD